MPLVVMVSEEWVFNETRWIAFFIKARCKAQISAFEAEGLLLIDGLIGMPSGQVLQNTLDETTQVFCFAHCTREDHCSESVSVEELLVKRKQFEIERLILVKKFDHPEAVFGVHSRDKKPWEYAVLK